MSDLRLFLLGAPRIELNGQPVRVERQKEIALLAYLAVTQQPHRRDLLATMLWPESNQQHARASLRRVLSSLQNSLRHQWLVNIDATLALPSQAGLWVDVLQFRQLLMAAEPTLRDDSRNGLELLAQAVDLYVGDFLSGFSVPDSPDFDEWQRLEAETLRRELSLSLERLCGGIPTIDPTASIRYARRWVQLDPFYEPAQLALIQLLAHSGEISAARREYQHFHQLVAEEFGEAPTPATAEFVSQLLQRPVEQSTSPPRQLSPPPDEMLTTATRLPRFLTEPSALHPNEPSLCVAREPRLSQLYSYLDGALGGQSQVVFVTGEAGTGKTTLLREFLRRSLDARPELIAAYGTCDAYAGHGTAYLPFRTILEMLTGAVEDQWTSGLLNQAQALRLWNVAPHMSTDLLTYGDALLETFVDGNALAARSALWSCADARWAPLAQAIRQRGAHSISSQPRLFEHYLAVIRRFSEHRPLLLVLDDLHWADASSIGLLFFLGRQLCHERILIVGAYRPEELEIHGPGRAHPFLDLREEFRRIYGNSEISLDGEDETEGRRFVDTLLDSLPNDLGEAFRQGLFRQSRGHPLFTVELLYDLQRNQQIVQKEDGRWSEGAQITWDSLPAKVEGVIAKRMSRLDRDLLEILYAASVEGEQFTAEVVASVCGVEPQQLVRRLSNDLARHHRLVEAHGVRLLNGRRLSLYRFRHNLFQQYLYQDLDPVERTYLHERVARSLEEHLLPCGKELLVHAGQLAHHFESAHIIERTIHYWQLAGEYAVKISANEEAVNSFSRALDLLRQVQPGVERDNCELALLVDLGVPLSAVSGYSHNETASVYRRARRLSVTTGNTQHLFPSLYGLWRYHLVRGHLRAAQFVVRQICQLESVSQNRELQLEAERAIGITYFHQGAPAEARIHLEQGLGLYDQQLDATHAYLYGHDPAVSCYSYLAPALWLLGDPHQAIMLAEAGLHLAKQLGHPFSLVHSWLNGAAQVHLMRREYEPAQALSQMAVDSSTKHRFPQWLGFGKVLLGASLAAQGCARDGIAIMQEGLATLQSIQMKAYQGFFLACLAESYARAGDLSQAQRTVIAGLDATARTGEYAWAAELHRLRGQILWEQGANEEQVEACFRSAVTVARQQRARSLELRAMVSLCQLWRKQDRWGEPQRRLEELYASFEEGFDTSDLREAKALLDR